MNNVEKKNIEMFVEIPKGSSNKYEFLESENKWILDRKLPVSMIYPWEYGFIPKTLSDDGDNLDVICLTDEKTFSGCHIPIRIIGAIEMIDNGEKDDKIIAINNADVTLNNFKRIEDLGNELINKIKHFFKRYKELDEKKVEIGKIYTLEEANKIIENCFDNYEKEKKNRGKEK